VNTLNREMKNRDGSVDKLIISSDDDYSVKLSKKYVLVGYAGNKHIDNYKNTIFGMDIGINSYGFASIMIMASLLALALLVGMYFLFRV